VLGMLAVMFVVVTIVFIIVRIAPGDPAGVMLGPDATAADVAALRVRLGLDRSIPVQYGIFFGQLVQGDLGDSIFLNRPVLTALAERAEPTFFLTMFSILIAATIALPVGILSAYWRGSLFDQAATTLAMLAASVPSFWLGLLLIQFFAVRLGLFPVSGYGGPGAGLGVRLSHLVLPALSLGIVSSALILRFTRASMLDVLNDDYVRTARSKGMSEFRVIMRHAFKNALIPVLTLLGLSLPALFSGAVFIEAIFAWPGVGRIMVEAVGARDYPVIMAATAVSAILVVFGNLLAEGLAAWADPRLRTIQVSGAA